MTIIIILQVISLLALCAVTNESILWAAAIFNHCQWARDNNIVDRRDIPYNSLRIFSVMSGVFSLLVWVVFVYVATVISANVPVVLVLLTVVMLLQMVVIHSWHLISTYICIPLEFVPYCSRMLIRWFNKLVGSKFNINSISLDKWEEMFVKSSKFKSLMFNFIDVVPRMIWTKDAENRYTFANKSMCDNILITPENEVINRTSIDISKELHRKGIEYTFGEVFYDTDEMTKERKVPTMFRSYGIINDKVYILRVLKAPIFDGDDIIGTIGVGEDITYTSEVFNRIEKLLEDGDYEIAREVFLSYKNRYESMRDYE